MAAAGDASAHTFPEGFEVYDDEKCMSAEAPSFECLKDNFIKGEAVRARTILSRSFAMNIHINCMIKALGVVNALS